MKKTVLSLEQALTLPYATQRFVQLGWRVIRIEPPPEPGTLRGGDPNRYIGEDTGFDDLHSYYIAPNVGKEAITLNLKRAEGQDLLKRLIRELPVDVFMCNTLPKRYKELGIDYATLSQANPDLIWCGISAYGPDHPDRAGYDPALQAAMGFMHLTGDPDGDPMLCGLPIIDLKAGDEAFVQVVLAIAEQQSHPGGKEIHISMAQCAASWLITALPQLAFVDDDSKLFTRSGNEHRSFIPCNCYPTKDGYVYLAIGNDLQWQKLTRIRGFEHLDKPDRKTNQGRLRDKDNIYSDIRKGLANYTTTEFLEICMQKNLPASPVATIREVAELDFVKNNMIKSTPPLSISPPVSGGESKGGRSPLPPLRSSYTDDLPPLRNRNTEDIPPLRSRGGVRGGQETIELFPAAVKTEFLLAQNYTLSFAPRLGEHNENICNEIGLDLSKINRLRQDGII